MTVPFTELPKEVQLALLFNPLYVAEDGKTYTQVAESKEGVPALYLVENAKEQVK